VEQVVPLDIQRAELYEGDRVRVVPVLEGEDAHHEWRKLPDSVGLFACRDRGCQWFAVCPGCLGSLDVAIRARDGVVGMALYWCPAHQGGGAHDG
jgi:hypothetical protein